MNIVTEDNRGLTDVNPINFQAREITFYDMKITGNFAKALEQMVKGDMRFVHDNTEKIVFQEGIHIYDMAGNYFVIEYSSKEERDNNIQGIKNNFQYDEKEIFAKKINDDLKERQVPEFDGSFEYNGKYYMIIGALNKLNENDIIPKKGIYKSVIISPDLYSKTSKQITKTKQNIDNII